MRETQNRMRLPSVDLLLRDTDFTGLLAEFGHSAVRDTIRDVLDNLRRNPQLNGRDRSGIAKMVAHELAQDMAPSLKAVFNLTGTILHTNLGRAPLPEVAIKAMQAAAGAVNLEYDLETGGRGQRDEHVSGWVKRLTGAEAAIAVNNNAAAVMLALNTLARGREVLVSRGELIEIGGAFRMPDIMERSGVKLREVGTTNRTHLKDFKAAIGPNTGMILKVHTSNYVVEGFTKTVPEDELADLAKAHGIPFVVDLGSGTLVDLARFGLPAEPTVRETIENGADLVTFSGDKLLGGPQAGIIAGRSELVAQLAANPMKRALRLDKVTLAALSAVLRLYANPDRLAEHLPGLSALARTATEIEAQAQRLLPHVAKALSEIATVTTTLCKSQIGSGALPVDRLESFALVLTPLKTGDKALRDLAAWLRALPIPVIGRISNGALMLDLRSLKDEHALLEQLEQAQG
jgi:L-seryl-tRNA(Ser) seleniumtransferase